MLGQIQQVLIELVALSLLQLVSMRRCRSIDRTLKAMRRDLRRDRRWSRRAFARHRVRLDQHEARLDRHDAALDVDTRNPKST